MIADHLDATKRALLARAATNAAMTRAAAAQRAQSTLAEAQARAAELVSAAAATGEADARVAADRVRAAAQRASRERLLGAETDQYHALHAMVAAAVAGLAVDPAYPDLEKILIEYARRRLGADAVISAVPRGGIVAERANQRLDLSLDGFGRRALVAVLGEAEFA